MHTRASERSDLRLKPKFPRLALLQRRRRTDDMLNPHGHRLTMYLDDEDDEVVIDHLPHRCRRMYLN